MQTMTISATKARNNFFELLTWVSMGNHALVTKDAIDLAKIVPMGYDTNWVAFKDFLKSTKGISPKWDINDSPLRGKKAKAWLKKTSQW